MMKFPNHFCGSEFLVRYSPFANFSYLSQALTQPSQADRAHTGAAAFPAGPGGYFW